ncbi:MAG: hypothetical protein IJ468_11655 [Lachnospiraceae bacterium]|nr:hypothetical protein [Lachnospiraceae bacterium]
MSKEKTIKAETVEKEAVKKAAKKTVVKAAPKADIFVQFAGREVAVNELAIAAKQAFVDAGNKAGDAKDVKIYVKPEESAAYYVINDEFKGRIAL